MRTKMLTSGSLAGLQELLASWIAKDRSKHGHYFSSRVPKMAVYGAFVSAPLGHILIKILQKMFSGRTSLKAKILQILVSNLIVRNSGQKGHTHGISGADTVLYHRWHLSKTLSTSLPWQLSRAPGPSTRFAPP